MEKGMPRDQSVERCNSLEQALMLNTTVSLVSIAVTVIAIMLSILMMFLTLL